jgi:hypothetical protein
MLCPNIEERKRQEKAGGKEERGGVVYSRFPKTTSRNLIVAHVFAHAVARSGHVVCQHGPQDPKVGRILEELKRPGVQSPESLVALQTSNVAGGEVGGRVGAQHARDG